MSGLTMLFDRPAKTDGDRRRCRVFDLERRGRRNLRHLRHRDRDQLRARIVLPGAVRQARQALNEQAIVVDLSDCAESRGIVEALPSANLTVDEPDTEFMISPSQLACLKPKLEDPNIELDPSATIDLAACI